MTKRFVAFTGILLASLTAFWFLSGLRVVYVSPQGDDGNPGTKALPVRSIQRGVHLANRGGLIEILPGNYRESIDIPRQDTALPLIIRAENKNDIPIISGSEPSSRLSWELCTDTTCRNILAAARPFTYVTTIPWDEAPTMLTYKGINGTIQQLTLARSPNRKISDKNKYHQHWWHSDNPGASLTALSDTDHLLNTPSVSGGRAYIVDGADRCGTYMYIRTITDHNPHTASFTVDMPIGAETYGIQESGLSTYSKYFIENAAGLLDEQGEWYYDPSAKKLYLFPPDSVNPEELSIEIARKNTAISINRSRVFLLNLVIQNINDAVYADTVSGAIVMTPENNLSDIQIRNITIHNAGNGIYAAPKTAGKLRNIVIDSADIRNVSKSAIAFTGLPDISDTITGITIQNSSVFEAAFPHNEPAINIVRSSDVRIHKNIITDTAGYGIHVTGFEKSNKVSRGITISNNSIRHSCQNASSCASVKIFGGKFAETTVKNNSLGDNLGWSYCHEATDGGQGYAMGIFISNAEGIVVARNTSTNNSGPAFLAYTRQIPATDNVFFRNTAANSSVGISLDGAGSEQDTDPVADSMRHKDTYIIRNKIYGNTIGLKVDPTDPESLRIKHNSYIQNGTAIVYGNNEAVLPSVINSVFPFWEK